MGRYKRRRRVSILLFFLSVAAVVSVCYIGGRSEYATQIYQSYFSEVRDSPQESYDAEYTILGSDEPGQPQTETLLGDGSSNVYDGSLMNKFRLLQERGQQFTVSDTERELVLKYWELKSWLKRQRPTWQDDSPTFFNFSGYDLWGNQDLVSPSDDRFIGQLVWAMQLIIQHFIRSHGGLEDKARHNQSKSIFLGDFKTWPAWALSKQSRHQKQLVGCFDSLLAPHIKKFQPRCDLVNQLPQDWAETPTDAIASYGDEDPVPNFELDPPFEIPWYKYSAEPPLVRRVHLDRPAQYINSYWSQSLIPRKHAKWVYYDPDVRSKSQDRNYSDGKTKMIAVYVPNCKAWNNRVGYVKALQQFLPVDIYGRCAEKKEFRQTCKTESKCAAKIGPEYLFYLAFEKVNCREYISQVFFHSALSNNLIPIVMGAHQEDYHALAPQNSYIHVEDFESPKELAAYVRLLAENSTLYNSYFAWRSTGEFVENPSFLCRLCPMLHYAEQTPEPSPTANNEIDWEPTELLSDKTPICLSKNKWMWDKIKRE